SRSSWFGVRSGPPVVTDDHSQRIGPNKGCSASLRKNALLATSSRPASSIVTSGARDPEAKRAPQLLQVRIQRRAVVAKPVAHPRELALAPVRPAHFDREPSHERSHGGGGC